MISPNNSIFIYAFYAARLCEFVKSLGFKVHSALGFSGYRPVVVMLEHVLQGRRLTIWIPHLSPLDFSAFTQTLISSLEAYQIVKRIDDGMGFVSRDTLIYRNNYISTRELIYSWDFTPDLARLGFHNTITRSLFGRAVDVVASSNPSLMCEGLPQIEPSVANRPGKQIRLILVSKLLDEDVCMKPIKENDVQACCFYIPHYNAAKHSRQFSLKFPSIQLGMPEFGLLGIAEVFSCTIYFGITATAIFCQSF